MSSKHVLITGPPGVGKTTLVKKLCARLTVQNKKFEGFYTEEIRNGRERIGFDIVTTSGKRGILSRISDQNSKGMPKVGKYAVDVRSFESLALPMFDLTGMEVLILDEIGKMELFSRTFTDKVKHAFNSESIRIIATIPISKSVPFVEEIRNGNDCMLIQVSKENRDSLEETIVNVLKQ